MTGKAHLVPFLKFGVIGVVGLAVDLAALFLLAPVLGWYAGRIGSFLLAASVTWWLNRSFTFKANAQLRTTAGSIGREYLRYMVSMLGGAAINYAIYVLTLHFVPGPWAPTLGVALGSLGGMLLNYFAARRFAFRAPGTATAPPVTDK